VSESVRLWADPRLVYSVAIAAVGLLVAAIWLFGRRKKQGRQAGMVCLVVSVLLHTALILLVPLLPGFHGAATVDPADDSEVGSQTVSFATFDPDLEFADASADDNAPALTPLPVADLIDIHEHADPSESIDAHQTASIPEIPEALTAAASSDESIASELDELLQQQAEAPTPATDDTAQRSPEPPQDPESSAMTGQVRPESTSGSPAPEQTVAGETDDDFANRIGAAKDFALVNTGGDENTEAAVAAALRFLATHQRRDGGWDPQASGAGVERSPLGLSRGGAGARADTAITGLALLTMLGAGNTHAKGDYADNVYRGLVYLMRTQKPDGSLSGNAAVYASTYSHGMAALAMCEAAAITGDAAAVDAATRAIAHTRRIQHPTTGGWRYLQGDPGDLSQLGWQAMVVDAGDRAGVAIDPKLIAGTRRFLRSVRSGQHGGLASYRPGERASPTMTAEALATRLLLGDHVSEAEIDEAESYLLQNLPGTGTDNYYYWYYATLALHQLQDDAWRRWNEALKARLLSTQQSDGSWSSDTLWGGYGGTVYTTSMAALCLETYYRHATGRNRPRLVERIDPSPVHPSPVHPPPAQR